MSWFALHKLISQLRSSTFSSSLLGRKLSSSQSSTKNFRMSQVLRPFTCGKTLTVILSVVKAYILHYDKERHNEKLPFCGQQWHRLWSRLSTVCREAERNSPRLWAACTSPILISPCSRLESNLMRFSPFFWRFLMIELEKYW